MSAYPPPSHQNLYGNDDSPPPDTQAMYVGNQSGYGKAPQRNHHRKMPPVEEYASFGERATWWFIDKDLRATPWAIRGLQSVAIIGALHAFFFDYVTDGWQGVLNTGVTVIIYSLLTWYVVRGLSKRNGTARMIGFPIAIMHVVIGSVATFVSWGDTWLTAHALITLTLGLAWFFFDYAGGSKKHFAPEVD